MKSAPAVVDGTVYVGNDDGTIYTLEGTETEFPNEETETSTGDTDVYTGVGKSAEASESSPNPSFYPYCGTDLSEYPAAAFCLECGTEL